MLSTHALHHHYHRGSIVTLDLEKLTNLNTLATEINGQVALFRDMLMHVGQSKDCPELREKIRKLRRICVDTSKHTAQIIMQQIKSVNSTDALVSTTANTTALLTVTATVTTTTTTTTILSSMDNAQLVLFYHLMQLFRRELIKSHRLVQVVPMDMSGYYENRAGPSNLGNVISQILLCKTIRPDFNQEELCSIAKDSQDIGMLLKDLQPYMPHNEAHLERGAALESNSSCHPKAKIYDICENVKIFCCLSRRNLR